MPDPERMTFAYRAAMWSSRRHPSATNRRQTGTGLKEPGGATARD
jgi:hypothetical protein